MKTTMPALALFSALYPIGGPLIAEIAPEKVSAVQNANQDSVLSVIGSLKWSCGRCSRLHEGSVHAPAIVLSSSGLLLMSMNSCVQFKVEKSDLKVFLPSGKELPVRVLMSDADLGVALLVPESLEAHKVPRERGNRGQGNRGQCSHSLIRGGTRKTLQQVGTSGDSKAI